MTVLGAASLLLAAFVLLAAPASANSLPITGSAACAQNGTYTVTYVVSPPRPNVSWTAYVSSFRPTSSQLAQRSFSGTGTSSFSIVQSGVASTESTASITVQLQWSDGTHDTGDGSVALGGVCTGSTSTPVTSTPVTSTPVTSTATTSAPPPSSTAVTSVPVSSSTAVTTTPVTTTPVTTTPVTTTPVTTTPVSSTAPVSTVNAPPPPVSSSAAPISSAAVGPTGTSAINNPPPIGSVMPTEATNASTTPAQNVQAQTDVAASPSTELASTGADGSVPRTLALAAALAMFGTLLLLLAHRRQRG